MDTYCQEYSRRFTHVSLVLCLQPIEEEGKINFELEERKYRIYQRGKVKEVKERDPFDAVEDFRPVGVPWRGRLTFAFTVKFYCVKQVEIPSFFAFINLSFQNNPLYNGKHLQSKLFVSKLAGFEPPTLRKRRPHCLIVGVARKTNQSKK